MARWRFLLLISLTWITPGSAAYSQVRTSEIVELASPAVVTVVVKTDVGRTQGSGFIVDPAGVVLTNFHVVDGALAASVKLPNGDVYEEVRVVAEDERRDIAVIRIPGFGLPTLPLGNSDSVFVGDDIVVIGSPLGLENTVSTGIISGRREFEGYSLFQITAPISPGSSGGPILTRDGRVIGLAVAGIEAGQNLNFAIPINYARGLVLDAGAKEGVALEPLGLSEEAPTSELVDAVNTFLDVSLEDYGDYAYEVEYEDDNGLKTRMKIFYRLHREPGDPIGFIERITQEETKYKSEVVGRITVRERARADDLTLVSGHARASHWDGQRWSTFEANVSVEDNRARGRFTDLDGTTRVIDRTLPSGIISSNMVATLAGTFLDKGITDNTTVTVVSYDFTRDQISDMTVSFRPPAKRVKEAGQYFEVLEVEIGIGPDVSKALYNLEKPHYLVRTEGAGYKGKLEKILEN